MNILIIEDAKDLAFLLQEMLEGLGHKVTWKNDRSGMDEEDILPHDLIISDFSVPGGHFYETRDLAKFCGKPLILISSIPRPGVHDYFIDKADLGTKLRPMVENLLT